MKQFIFLSLIIITVIILTPQIAHSSSLCPNFDDMLIHLPRNITLPARLPCTIDNPALLEAWIHIYYNDKIAISWDGNQVTGSILAQQIIEREIPIQWDTEGKCQGSSCSIRYCVADTCDYEDGNPGVDPIYISLALKGDLSKVILAVIHEMYHRLEPFGTVRSSLYEEFWAYYVEAQLSGGGLQNFTGTNPLNLEDLRFWFETNQPGNYTQLPNYPAEIEGMVNQH